MPVAPTRRVGFVLLSALIMETEGSSAREKLETEGGSLPIAYLRALLRHSLSEILKENLSLLQPLGVTQHGKLAALMMGARYI